MLRVDERTCDAAPDVCFEVAADVEEWPNILPHYRWVRFLRREGFARGVVEMAAWRRFGPFRYPTWWISEMNHDPEARVVRYLHVDGITRGMDVVWSVNAVDEERTLLRIVHEWAGPAWPGVGSLAADRVIGPASISHIARRTLAGIAAEAERRQRLGP